MSGARIRPGDIQTQPARFCTIRTLTTHPARRMYGPSVYSRNTAIPAKITRIPSTFRFENRSFRIRYPIINTKK